MFAVIYQGYVKEGREELYRKAWKTIAAHFVKNCGSLGSTLHQCEDGSWLAYSRWPNRATRDASWTHGTDLPQQVLDAISSLKECLEGYEEICMEVKEDV